MSEKEVFIQNVSDVEMESVAGGEGQIEDHCVNCFYRDIYNPSFPNCAATVEADSWCVGNDACFSDAVNYQGMTVCDRAWK